MNLKFEICNKFFLQLFSDLQNPWKFSWSILYVVIFRRWLHPLLLLRLPELQLRLLPRPLPLRARRWSVTGTIRRLRPLLPAPSLNNRNRVVAVDKLVHPETSWYHQSLGRRYQQKRCRSTWDMVSTLYNWNIFARQKFCPIPATYLPFVFI